VSAVTEGDPWKEHLLALGDLIRSQRRLANLSLRQLAELAQVSNPYLSQIERGLHQPSLRVLVAIAEALGMPPDTLLARAGMLREDDVPRDASDPRAVMERTIRADPLLTDEQKDALLAVYRSYATRGGATGGAAGSATGGDVGAAGGEVSDATSGAAGGTSGDTADDAASGSAGNPSSDSST
jgi:transcriptional regulator with XRE-family HTH domain